MANDILVLADHLGGQLSDTTLELVGKAKELAGATGGQAVVALLGAPDLAGQISGRRHGADRRPSGAGRLHPRGVGEDAPGDLSTSASPAWCSSPTRPSGWTSARRCRPAGVPRWWPTPVGLEADGGDIVATAQVYGGKLLAEVALTGDRGVCTVVAGSFPAAGAGARQPGGRGACASRRARRPQDVVPHHGRAGRRRRRHHRRRHPRLGRAGESAARTTSKQVQELADAIGAPLSASRPVTDSGWLPKTRQVGKSGLKVKPKVYLTFGISGAPEHLEGMRDAELIIACNTDEAAPIFDVAHYGTTVDLFDLVPAMTDKLG